MSNMLSDIKELRRRTGAGIVDCRDALIEVKDLAEAEELLKQRGKVEAEAKADRTTSAGVVHCYVHAGNRIGVMVEV